MKTILKSFALIAALLSIVACDVSVSSDPKSITKASYSGKEQQFPKNIGLVTIENNKNYTAKIQFSTNYIFTINYLPLPPEQFKKIKDIVSNDFFQDNTPIKGVYNGEKPLNYIINVKYPNDGKFTKSDFENLTSQMVWPLIIRHKLSQPEAEAAVAVFSEYARDYMLAYSKAQNLQGAEREKVFASAGKYANLKHNFDYKSFPKVETVISEINLNVPKYKKFKESKIHDIKIILTNGKFYNYVLYSTIYPPETSIHVKRNSQWKSTSIMMNEKAMEQAQKTVESYYKKLKDTTEVDFDTAKEISYYINKHSNTLTHIIY